LAELPATNAHGFEGEQPALAPGERLGGYVVEGELARGGMGVVYRARDAALGRPVALKVIAPALGADRVFRERFRRESRLAAQVEHPAVVPVYRAGQDRGRLFIAMRFIEGTDLATVLRDGPLSPARTAALIDQVAGALDAAHARGLVHRDVKPGNVLLSQDGERAFLTDFGLTIEIEAEPGAALTRTGHWVGTVAYAAPEQLRGGDVEARTDVYSLGGVLHHCLTGRVPYPVMNDLDAITAHLLDPPPRPSSVVAGIPRALDSVVARAMSKDPAARYSSAGDLAAAASAAVAGRAAPNRERSVATGAAAPRDPAPAPRRRLWPLVAVAGAAAVATAIAVGLSVGDGDRGRPSGPTVIRVAGEPGAIALAGGAVWTMTPEGGRLQRTDPRTGRSRGFPAPVDLGGGEFPALAGGDGALWQVQGATRNGGVTKVDPRDGSALGRAPLPGARSAVAGSDGVWATAVGDSGGRLVRIDPGSARVVAGPVAAGREPAAVAWLGDSVWVADRRRNAVARHDPQTLQPRERVAVGNGPGALAAAGGQLWVANLGDDTLTHVDPAAGEVVGAPVSLGKQIEAIAGSPGTLWVAAADGTVSRLDPRTGSVRGAPIPVGRPPLSLAAAGGSVWLASAADQTVRRLSPGRSAG
jgi:DNA-binding beta-propeller fold protein YncE